MTYLTRTLFLLSAIALSACGQGGFRGGADGAGGALGSAASDPTSVAFFNQTVGDRVLFAVDIYTLSPEARAVLDGQAAWLANNPEYAAVIEGHADEQGTQEYNFRLGERRANSVQQYLISRGVAPNRLRTVSFGKERPLEICSTEACYMQNRRSVTVLEIASGA
ncbi:MAG: peptidoglycan-associated lipoprotein Pal [Pseudomonadota bacterium]